MSFTDKAKIIDRGYKSCALESTGCKLQYESTGSKLQYEPQYEPFPKYVK